MANVFFIKLIIITKDLTCFEVCWMGDGYERYSVGQFNACNTNRTIYTYSSLYNIYKHYIIHTYNIGTYSHEIKLDRNMSSRSFYLYKFYILIGR